MASRRRGIDERKVKRKERYDEDEAWRKERYERRRGMEEGEV